MPRSPPAPTVGSSPRVWGTLLKIVLLMLNFRFIPTGVGNTRRRGATLSRIEVHPHGRGEHHPQLIVSEAGAGSSPRSWGTRYPTQSWFRPERFIPTLVGNTYSANSSAWARSVHPHARGEHGKKVFIPASLIGSSPRSWGTHILSGYHWLYNRFIPTLVGNTECPEFVRGV